MFFNKIVKSQSLQQCILKKYLSTTEKTWKKYKEVEIKVPWGRLTGKYWGSSNTEPILAFHGWQDNACSFDPLAQNLPDNISLLAIDFPGHGFSSWIPGGFMYNSLIYLQAIHRVKEYYGMKTFALMGHSLGGMISFMYTSLFPNNIKFVVAFDYFKYPSLNADKHLPMFIRNWDEFFKYENLSTSAPSYTEEEAIARWIKASRNSIDESMCKILMQRGATKKSDGKLFFHRDPRVKLFLTDSACSHDHLRILAMQIHGPCMIIKGEKSIHNEPKELTDDILKIIKEHSSDFRSHTVPGTHHFHMSNAKEVAEIISPFADQYMK